jgi:hypothetical protein
MKSLLILCSLFIATSTAYAETYKWEDANGVHLTDNPTSIPDEYRAKALREARADTSAAKMQAGMSPSRQNAAIAEPDYQADNEPNRIAAEAIRAQQPTLKAHQATQAARMERELIQPLARFLAIWILVGVFTCIVWLLTLIDILRSEFTNPTNKIVWLLLVICIAPLGVLLYYMIGLNQKIGRLSATEKERAELVSRLYPKEREKGDFKIS